MNSARSTIIIKMTPTERHDIVRNANKCTMTLTSYFLMLHRKYGEQLITESGTKIPLLHPQFAKKILHKEILKKYGNSNGN